MLNDGGAVPATSGVPRSGPGEAPLSQAEIDMLLDQIHVPFAVQGAALTLAIEGLLVLALGIQNLVMIHWRGSYAFVPLAMTVAGVGAIVLAVKLMRARPWAYGAALAAGIVLLVGTGVWFLVMIFSGLISALGLLTVGAGLVATLFLVVAMGPFARVTGARRRLRRAGVDVDM
jgi:predicted Co/Zn/Cd cation transporter (cation efflux family)